MNYKTYSSTGFVIARHKFGEADRIIILFTKDFGKIPVIAKGVRKITSKKRGGVEIFNHIKFSAVKSHSLDILTEIEILDSFSKLRTNLPKVTLAYYFCEIIGKTTQDGELHREIYEILNTYFSSLLTTNKLKILRFAFIKDMLTSLGFWPVNKPLDNPDEVLESVIERKLNSSRVGKKMLQRD